MEVVAFDLPRQHPPYLVKVYGCRLHWPANVFVSRQFSLLSPRFEGLDIESKNASSFFIAGCNTVCLHAPSFFFLPCRHIQNPRIDTSYSIFEQTQAQLKQFQLIFMQSFLASALMMNEKLPTREETAFWRGFVYGFAAALVVILIWRLGPKSPEKENIKTGWSAIDEE